MTHLGAFGLSLSLCLAAAAPANAQPAADTPPAADVPPAAGSPLAKARELYQRGEFARARDQLLIAYRAEPSPALLFALGQVEFNLAHYADAIAYYEKFLATSPDGEQAALAQQAIGAARARVAEPPPPAPAPRHIEIRRWDAEDSGLVALGGTAIAVGTGLVIHGYLIGKNRGGTLSAYDDRWSYAHSSQRIGIGVAVGGVIAIAAAIVRWRVHTEDALEVGATASATSAGVTVGRSW